MSVTNLIVVKHEAWKKIIKKHKKEMKHIDIEAIEETKRKKDPLYFLLYFPNIKLSLKNNNTTHAYIDRFLFTAIDICERKIGLSMYDDPLIKRVCKQVCSPEIRNQGLKLFILFALMWLEPVVIDFVRASYTCKKRLQRFNEILPHLLSRVYHILHSGFNIYNIKAIKNDFINTYLIPWYQVGGVF